MLIGTKDLLKNAAVSVVVCCAVFVCTLFLSFNADLALLKDELPMQSMVVYDALTSTGKVTAAVSGGCLAATTLVMLIFYIKNYIDTHGKELGILKALGHSRISIARRFSVFGISVFVGAAIGYATASIYMPAFYRTQNNEALLPEITPSFQPLLLFLLVLLPPLVFAFMSVLYAFLRLKTPVLSLIKGDVRLKQKHSSDKNDARMFLPTLKKSMLKNKRMPLFLVFFSAFCFSAMTQMSMSMRTLASENFAWIMIVIGLVLAFMTLLMALTSAVSASKKTVAMMKAFGYTEKECTSSVLAGYKYVALVGFAVGTVYQYALLRMVVDIIFANYENMPTYNFDIKAMCVSFAVFVASYLLISAVYARKIGRASLKSIMTE